MAFIYVALLVAGVLLIGAEIYLPGGVIGFLGGVALLGAIVVGFIAFPPVGGVLSCVGVLVLSGLCVYFWLRYFPKTRMGRNLTLTKDGRDTKATPDLQRLVGQEGIALSDLRPSGIAQIGGQPVDVIADGAWIPRNAPLLVERVENVRVLVRELPARPPAETR